MQMLGILSRLKTLPLGHTPKSASYWLRDDQIGYDLMKHCVRPLNSQVIKSSRSSQSGREQVSPSLIASLNLESVACEKGPQASTLGNHDQAFNVELGKGASSSSGHEIVRGWMVGSAVHGAMPALNLDGLRVASNDMETEPPPDYMTVKIWDICKMVMLSERLVRYSMNYIYGASKVPAWMAFEIDSELSELLVAQHQKIYSKWSDFCKGKKAGKQFCGNAPRGSSVTSDELGSEFSGQRVHLLREHLEKEMHMVVPNWVEIEKEKARLWKQVHGPQNEQECQAVIPDLLGGLKSAGNKTLTVMSQSRGGQIPSPDALDEEIRQVIRKSMGVCC